MNEKSRHHPLNRAFETERMLYPIMRERHERICRETWSCRFSLIERMKASHKAWGEFLVSMGIEFHDNSQPMKSGVLYVNDPDGPGFRLLAVPEELALKILVLGAMP